MATTSSKEVFRPAFPHMQNAPYTSISYGLPFADACSKHIQETFQCKRPYIIASNSLSKYTNHLNTLQDALKSSLAGTWVGIKPHTFLDELLDVAEDIRRVQADIIITLGGGSQTDAAKIISLALANSAHTVQDVEALSIADEKKYPPKKPPQIPTIFVPITLSGAELSKYGGGTVPETLEKKMFTDAKMYASLVVLDPALSLDTPIHTWLSTGVRAIDHCVEAICSTNAKPSIDAAAEQGLRALVPGLLATSADKTAIEPRLQSQLGVCFSMAALAADVWKGASHGIGHQLGPLGVSHGDTSCILLPAVMKYNKSANAAQQAKIKEILWSEAAVREVLVAAGLEEASSDAGDALYAIFARLGLPQSLEAVGVGRDRFEMLARNSLKDWFCQANARSLTEPEQVMVILDSVADA